MKNLFLAAVAALAFCGCAGIASSANKAERDVSNIDVLEDNWTRYLDTDGAVREVAFLTAFFSRDFRVQPADGETTGFALTKKEGSRLPFRLGAVYKSGDRAFMLKDADTEAEFDLKDEASATRLRGARRIKFYEFSSNLTTVAVFEAPISVCKAFFGGEPISARSVTNYYVGASDEFFAIVIDVRIVGNKGFEIKNLDFKFNLPSSKLAEAKEQATSAKFRQDVIEQDVKKQGRILLNILCYYSMPSK